MRRGILALVALSVIALGASASSVFGRAAAGGSAPVDAKVLDELAARGHTSFWVVLKQEADLQRAGTMRRSKRGEYVYEQLRATAASSQSGLRALLAGRRAGFRSFWIVNALRVTGDESLLRELSAEPEVKEIHADHTYELLDPKPAGGAQTQEIAWGIAAINAPQVWSGFGDRGEGIVVANIDSGVEFDHPALVTQYRGNLGGGSFDHDYDWFDPSKVCGNPSTAPCDNSGHGTHTMGTMVGDDGNPGPNQIGVAPRAKWIAAKGCESNSCSESALFSAGQWILAPTNLAGNNPRPDLRPDIVNNSWGGGVGNPWYQSILDAWAAAGIFPAFSNGNAGAAGCGSARSPGEYVDSYSAGAFDSSGNIAGFSSRGPSTFGAEGKPNIAAPGVAIRSSVPGGSYTSASGTSMASPHVAGTVALMWSVSPALRGNVAATRRILDETATDVMDVTCGGTPGDNNVWGEGKLNALAAVTRASTFVPPPPPLPPPPPPAAPPPPPPPPPPARRPPKVVRCRVPNAVGLRSAVAKARIRAAHCSVGRTRTAQSKRAQSGRVIGQTPRRGAVRPRGFAVRLTIGRR